MSERIFNVVQIGYGPVGQTMAALLAAQGHDVAVFERHPALYALPRAGHVDHEIMRIFQSIGAAEAMATDMFRCARYGWRNQHGQTLLDIDWSQEGVSGWASDYLMYQPYVEDALDAAARRNSTLTVEHGWEARAIRRLPEAVEVDLARVGSTDVRTVRARYLIGADGANSVVRQACGIDLEDLGFREQWLVADFRQKRPLSFDFDNGQICDPGRPMCLFQLGKTHRRFEFMVLPGEDSREVASDAAVWKLVEPWMSPEDADLIRAAPYTFRSANAATWRAGRVLLAGDAAHLMPPFMGQGMCSGVRDAANLAWKLDLVLRHGVDDVLLDSYEVERKPHVGAIIDQAVALGRISCMTDPVAAAERDDALLRGLVPPPPPFPWIKDGILHPEGAVPDLVGRLGPQGIISGDAREGRADDIVGAGWQLISRDDVSAQLSAASHRIMRTLDIKPVVVGADRLGDHDDVYARFLSVDGASALLVRPDFYVFAAPARMDQLDTVLEDLASRLGLRSDALAEMADA